MPIKQIFRDNLKIWLKRILIALLETLLFQIRMYLRVISLLNGQKKIGPIGKSKGLPVGHGIKLGPNVLKPNNHFGEHSGKGQHYFDNGSSIA